MAKYLWQHQNQSGCLKVSIRIAKIAKLFPIILIMIYSRANLLPRILLLIGLSMFWGTPSSGGGSLAFKVLPDGYNTETILPLLLTLFGNDTGQTLQQTWNINLPNCLDQIRCILKWKKQTLRMIRTSIFHILAIAHFQPQDQPCLCLRVKASRKLPLPWAVQRL